MTSLTEKSINRHNRYKNSKPVRIGNGAMVSIGLRWTKIPSIFYKS